jgi:uncharacterized iron-regulated membrane protein
MDSQGQAPTFTSERGATVKTTYVEREVQALAVFDTEVETISSLNTQATVFFSVGTGLISLAGGIWTSAAFSTQLTPAGQLAVTLAAPVLCLLSLVFFGLALVAWWKRKSALNTIRSQSRSQTR